LPLGALAVDLFAFFAPSPPPHQDDSKLSAFGALLKDQAVVHAVLSATMPVALSPQQLQVSTTRRASSLVGLGK
jgi:hypothetical protein